MAKALNVSLAVTADTSQAKAQLQQLQTTLQQLTTNSANLQIGIDPKKIQEASKYALDLAAHLKTATDPTTGTLNFTKFESQVKHAGMSIQQYGQQLLNLGPQGRQAFMQMTEAIAKSEIPMKRMSGVLGQFGTVIANTIRWQASSSLIHGFMGSIQRAYSYAQDLNQSLNNIQIVTQMSDTQMGKFAESANKAAKSLSTTTTSYTDAALIYYQQGIRDQNEINKRTDATIKMANVTGQSAQQVSNQMTAIWNNFAKGGDNLEYYADVITALGAATASSSEEISRGLEKFAATADTVGLSYENATAALATITATTRQSADSVGTGLRTLFARLDSLKLGETLEDGVDLTKYTKALQSVGVQVLDTNGNLKRMDDILDELGEKWGNISDTQKVALAQTVGGVRQYTTLMALMNNFDFYKENVDIAKNSQGTLQTQQEIFEKSWAASSKRVRASLETIYSSLINDKFFIDFNDGFAKVLDTINNIIVGLGGMKGILGTLSGSLMQTFSPQITQGLYNFGTGVADFFTLGTASQSRRNRAVEKSTAMYLGVDLKKGEKLNLNALPEEQRVQGEAFANYMQMQQLYAQNVQYMTPWMQDSAKMGMDQYKNLTSQREQQYNALQDLERKMNYDMGLARADLLRHKQDIGVVNTLQGLMQESAKREYNLQLVAQGKKDYVGRSYEELKADLGAPFLNKYGSDLFGLEDTGKGLVVSEFSRDSARRLLGAADQYRGGIVSQYQELFSSGGVNDSLAKRIINQAYDQATGKINLENLDEETKRALQRAQDAAKAKSAGMKVASGITNFAGGTMSAMTAATQFNTLADAVERVREGSVSMGEGLTQALTAGSMGAMNLMRSMKQFATLFGGNMALGGVMAIFMTALPSIIETFDTLSTTTSERLGIIDSATEQASTKATEAKTAYDQMLNSFKGHSNLLDTLDNLTAGTLEFKEALLEANEAAYKLINDYGLDPNKDTYTDENGAIHITDEAQERVQEQKLQEQRQAYLEQRAMSASQANVKINDTMNQAYTEYDALVNQLAKNFSRSEEYFKYTGGMSIGDRTQLLSLGVNQYRTAEEEARYQELLTNYGTISDSLLKPVIDRFAKVVTDSTNFKSLQAYADKYTGGNLTELLGQLSADELRKNALIESGAARQNYLLATEQLKNIYDTDTLTKSQELLANAVATNQQYVDALDASKYKGVLTTHTLSAEALGDARLSSYLATILPTGVDALAAASWAGQPIKIPEGSLAQLQAGGFKTIAHQTELDLTAQQFAAMDLADVKRAFIETLVAKMNITNEEAEQQLEDIMSSSDYIQANGEGKNIIIRNALISQLSNFFSEKQLKAVSQVLDKNPALTKGIDEFSSMTGAELRDTYTALMDEAAKDPNGEYAQIYRDMATAMYDQYESALQTFSTDTFEGISENIDGSELLGSITSLVEKGLSIDDITKLQTLRSDLMSIMGDMGADKFAEVINDLDHGNKQLKTFYESIDFKAGAINVLKQIRSMKGFKDNAVIQAQYKAIFDAMGGESGIFSNLWDNVFTDEKLMKKMSETFKKTGKISAESIYELAESSQEVADALEIDTINAQGLADALALINDTDLDIDVGDISNALLKAMSTAGAVKSQLAEVFEYIDHYEKERSAADIGEFYQGLVKDVNTSISNGLFGDNLFKQSFKELFGEGGFKDLQNFLEKTANMTDKQKQEAWKSDKNMSRYRSAMKEVENKGHMGGMYDYYLNNPSGNADYIVLDENGKPIGPTIHKNEKGTYDIGESKGVFGYTKKGGFHISNVDAFFNQFQTQEDFNKFLQSQGASEEMARSMSSDLASRNEILNQTWQKGAAQQAYKNLMDSFKDGITKDNMMSQKEMNAFLKQYGEYFIEEQAAALKGKSYGLEKGTDVSKLTNLKDVADAFASEGMAYQDFMKNMEVYNKDGSINIDKMSTALQRLGISAESAGEIISQSAQDGLGKFTVQARQLDGTLQETDIKEWAERNGKSIEEDFGGSIAKAAEYMQQSMEKDFQVQTLTEGVTEALKSVFSGETENNITITPVVDKEQAEAEITDLTQSRDFTTTGHADLSAAEATVNAFINKNRHFTITGEMIIQKEAAGMNNAPGFAGGNHSNNDFQGIAETGELGPELWVHEGTPMLTGVHGRSKVFVSKGDQIFTAGQTREILRDNPSLQNLPGFAPGLTVYGETSGNGKNNGAAAAKDDKGKDYKPERYHVVSRQLTVLEKQYERLEKAKENAYGTNILDAIEDEIAAQDQVIAKQRELIQEVEKWKAEDLKKLKELGVKYTLDANGEIANWDALQRKYEEAAQTSDDENAKKIWEAIQQYEETVDKLRDETDKLQEAIYKQMQLRLEKITLQAELKIKFDDKQIELLNYSLEKLEDNVYAGAEALALMSEQMSRVHDQIISSREAITGIFAEMTDSAGKQIDITVDEFLAMSQVERDALDINNAFGEALEEQVDTLFEQIKALDEYKKNGVDRLRDAFKELTENVDNALDKFSYFSGVLTTLRDIIDLQNIKFPKTLRDSVKQVQTALMNTSTNSIKGYQNYYRSLAQEADALRQHLSETTDVDLAKQYQEQLDDLENKMRDCMSNLNDLWQVTLSQAKEDFEQQLDWLVEDYGEALSGIYGNLDMYGDAFDRERKVRDRYTEDYEKYYQLSKLQRSINKDLDKSAQAGYKGNKQLRDLLKEIEGIQESGRDMSAYELEVLEKRYEYFKALADLEEARDAKHTVRLQRDRNGNWGYVYTANEDELEDLQQKADDRLHELQQFVRSSQDDLEEQIQELYVSYASQRVDMIKQGASAEALAEFDQYYMDQLAYLRGQWDESLTDAGNTVDTARDRYKKDNFEIIDLFGETATAQLSAAESTTELLDNITTAMGEAAGNMGQLVSDYSDIVERLNELIGGDAPFAENLNKFVTSINQASNDYLDITKDAVDDFQTSFDKILEAARSFEENFMKVYQPILDANEKFLKQLQQGLEDLNRYKNKNDKSNTTTSPSSPNTGNGSGGGTGSGKGGSGGGSGGSSSGSGSSPKDRTNALKSIVTLVNSTTGPWQHDNSYHWKVIREQYSDGTVKMLERDKGYGYGKHSFGGVTYNNARTHKIQKCNICGYTKTTLIPAISKAEPSNKKSTSADPLKVLSTKSKVMTKLDSGGYTGDWGSTEGRLAILHEKEQVFNREDTARLLLASRILQTIDVQAKYASGMFGGLTSPGVGAKAQVVEQNIQISASFPNAVNHAEIEEAFNNLSNKAVQYANRKNR